MANARKPKVTFELTPTVQVSIAGKPYPFPRVRDDGDLISRFLRWTLDNEIFPNCRGGMSGGGRHIGYYAPEHIPTIQAWLLENGVIEQKEEKCDE